MKNRRYGIQPSNTTSDYQNCSFHKFRGKSSMQIPWRQQTHDLTRLPFLPALHSHQDCQHDKQAKHKLKGLSRNCRKKWLQVKWSKNFVSCWRSWWVLFCILHMFGANKWCNIFSELHKRESGCREAYVTEPARPTCPHNMQQRPTTTLCPIYSIIS
jgi:hypothetical protein